MKTAISLEDALLTEANKAAQDLGVSRSRLISLALKSFLRRRRRKQILEQLNRAYEGGLDPEEKETLRGMKAKFQSTLKDPW